MKRATGSTLIAVTATRIVRADFGDSLLALKETPRAAGVSTPEAVRIGLASGGRATGTVWVLGNDVWAQSVALSPAQTAGLTPEQLSGALSFEVEPFSGIAASESVTGYHRSSEGLFDVVEIARPDRDLIIKAVAQSGGTLGGITHLSALPEEEASLRSSLTQSRTQLEAGAIAVITPPAPAPSSRRYFLAGATALAAVLVFLFGLGTVTALQRQDLTRRNNELMDASAELDRVQRQNATLQKELASLEKAQSQRQRIIDRRGALTALLKGLAATRPEDVVLRGIQAEGPSTLIVNGLALQANAVDEMSIVLTQRLKSKGWVAQSRQKTGTNLMPGGGPWEFSLTITHEEAAAAKAALQLSQRNAE